MPRASFRQRPHEFVDWFHRRFGGSVLWVDPYPVRLPRLADLRRPHVATATAAAMPPWLDVVAPTALPLEPLALGRGINDALFWPRMLRRVQGFAAQDRTLVAVGKPSHLALRVLEELPALASLYDAMDDFAAFHTGLSRRTAQAVESAILRRARLRITSSLHLQQRWQAMGLDSTLVPNGVATDRLPAPAQANEHGPFGYVGTVAAWFDWAWVEALATAWPQRRIEIHGPVFQRPPRPLPANVILGPAMPHEQALKRMRTFAAGLIPFLRTPLTESVDPVKFYEYRALGLPVISTAFGEMRRHGQEPGVLLTDTPAADRSAIRDMLAHRDAAESVAAFRRRHDWDARFAPLADKLALAP